MKKFFLPESSYSVCFFKTEGKLNFSYESNDDSFLGEGEITNVEIYSVEIFNKNELFYRGYLFRSFTYTTDLNRVFGEWINLIPNGNIAKVVNEFEKIEEQKNNKL